MALIKCKNCNIEISDKAIKCPKCGTELKKVKNNKKDMFINIFVLVILVVYSIGIIYWNINEIFRDLEVYDNVWVFMPYLLKCIILALFFILFLWFMFAFYKFQKKTFNILSLIFLVLYILVNIIVNIDVFKGETVFLMDWLFDINNYGSSKVLPTILLYLFCQRDK